MKDTTCICKDLPWDGSTESHNPACPESQMEAVIKAFGAEEVQRCLAAAQWITLSGVPISSLSHDELLVIIAYQQSVLAENNRKANEEWVPEIKRMTEALKRARCCR